MESVQLVLNIRNLYLRFNVDLTIAKTTKSYKEMDHAKTVANMKDSLIQRGTALTIVLETILLSLLREIVNNVKNIQGSLITEIVFQTPVKVTSISTKMADAIDVHHIQFLIVHKGPVSNLNV